MSRVDDPELLRKVVDLAPGMLGYWDTQQRNRIANAAYLEWFGLTPETMSGMHLRDVLGPDIYAKNLPYIRAALAGRRQDFDRTIVDASGHTRYSQASYVPDIAEDGTLLGFSVLVTDVTARTLAEQALAREQARVDRLSDKLRVVGALSASLQELDPVRLQDAVADAVLALGFDGAVIVLVGEGDALRPRHGRGIFSVVDGTTVARGSTVTSRVLHGDAPQYVVDYADFPQAVPEVRATGVRSLVALPVRSLGEVVGVLQAGRTTVQPLADDDREVLGLLAAVAGTNLRHARSFVELRRSQVDLAEQALRDPLTGLANRRSGDALLTAVRPGDALAVLDLDDFKRVNDEHGHAAGDEVLRDLGALLQTQLRHRDRAVRLGGEEFLLVLPSTSLAEAQALVTRLLEVWRAGGATTTFSAGVAEVATGEVGEQAQLRADAVLYDAKRAGRDRVLVAAHPPDRSATPVRSSGPRTA